MMKEIMIIESECKSCGGTGLYVGFAEPKGTAVICLNCDGTGCRKTEYTPFVKRKLRKGVRSVTLSKGTFILNCGPYGTAITYEEFLNGESLTE